MMRADEPVPAGVPVAPNPGSARAAPEGGGDSREQASAASPLGGAATVFPDPNQNGPFDSVERLRILETLSYGVLYEGRVFQASRSEEVALLELDPAFDREPETFARTLTELVAASQLPRAGVQAPRGIFRHADRLYVLFDACPGVSLATAFEFLGPAGLRLSSEAILRIASSVLAALDVSVRERADGGSDAAHGLLTPENVFVAEGQRVLVRGFGIWPAGIGRLGLLGPRVRRYIAPSQSQTGLATARTDLLSLGMVLFEGLVGLPAFDSPPEEEDLADLRGSIGEFQAKAEPGLSDLFEITIACLTPPASLTPAYRSRLRKKIDTLFLREFTRDRAPKMINLEDLVTRTRPRRPVIVKARSIALAPAETDTSAPAGAERSGDAAADDNATVSVKMEGPASEAPAPPVRMVSYPPMTFGGPPKQRGFPRAVLWVAAFVTVAAAAVLILLPRSPSEEETAAALERAVVLPAPTAGPAVPTPMLPQVVPASGEPAPAASRMSGRETAHRGREEAPARRRVAAGKDPGKKREPPSRRAASTSVPQPSSAAPAPVDPLPADSRAVAEGALVPLHTAGLAAPVLIENPSPPRFQESDPRPARPHAAFLEILVSNSGRVRGSRILRADRFPPGFTEGIEKHLAGMRFRPAELGGVAVKVWIPYELQFLAP
jgi:hypothetical protein